MLLVILMNHIYLIINLLAIEKEIWYKISNNVYLILNNKTSFDIWQIK